MTSHPKALHQERLGSAGKAGAGWGGVLGGVKAGGAFPVPLGSWHLTAGATWLPGRTLDSRSSLLVRLICKAALAFVSPRFWAAPSPCCGLPTRPFTADRLS